VAIDGQAHKHSLSGEAVFGARKNEMRLEMAIPTALGGGAMNAYGQFQRG
jgi:hypothetical protein